MDSYKYYRGYWNAENPVMVQHKRQRAWLNAIAKTRHRKVK